MEQKAKELMERLMQALNTLDDRYHKGLITFQERHDKTHDIIELAKREAFDICLDISNS